MREIGESVNPTVIRLNGYRQICELLSLLCLTLAICGFALLDVAWKWQWTAGWILMLLVFLLLAFHFGRKAILEFVDARFSVTRQRLLTLRATRAPKDLIECLEDLPKSNFRGEQYYFRTLGRRLTPARCDELKSIIFKYTYVERKK
jgi:hypothetical protein